MHYVPVGNAKLVSCTNDLQNEGKVFVTCIVTITHGDRDASLMPP